MVPYGVCRYEEKGCRQNRVLHMFKMHRKHRGSDPNEEITAEETRSNQPFIKDIHVTLSRDEEFSPIIQFLQEDQLPANEKLAQQFKM